MKSLKCLCLLLGLFGSAFATGVTEHTATATYAGHTISITLKAMALADPAIYGPNRSMWAVTNVVKDPNDGSFVITINNSLNMTPGTLYPFVDLGQYTIKYTGDVTGSWSNELAASGTATFTAAAFVPDYYWDGVIPANTSDHDIVYKFYQGSTEVSSYTQSAGAGVQNIHLTGLTPGTLVTVVAQVGGYVSNSQGVPVWTPNETREVVGGGRPTAAAEPPPPSSLFSPSAADIGARAPSVALPNPVTAPTAPTPSTPPAAPVPTTPVSQKPATAHVTPTGVPVPYPTPSGTNGVTKADIEDATNKLISDLNTTRADAAENANRIITSVDGVTSANIEALGKVINAVDAGTAKAKESSDNQTGELQKLSLLTSQSSTALLTALNTGNSLVTTGINLNTAALKNVSDNVRIVGDKIVELDTGMQNLSTPPQTPVWQAAANAAVSFADTKAAEQQAKWNARAIPSITKHADTTASPTFFDITFLGKQMNVDPVLRWPWLFNWCKGLIAWTIALMFVAWLWVYFPQLNKDILTAGPAKINTTALAGAIPMLGSVVALFLTTFIVIACLAAPVALFAVADSGIYPTLLANVSVDPRNLLAAGGAKTEAILYLLDACFPVATGLTAIVEYFVIKKAGTIIATGVQMFVRALPI